MLKLTVHYLLDSLENHIYCDKLLRVYAGDDFDSLRELVNEFIGVERYDVNEECLKNPRKLIGRLLNIFIWDIDKSTIKSYTLNALIGYSYLLRSHIEFRENERATR
jgi:hypothetical protein